MTTPAGDPVTAELDRLAKRHAESPGAPPDQEHVCLGCWMPWPCDAARLIELARLGAAWQAAEAALPEGWRIGDVGRGPSPMQSRVWDAAAFGPWERSSRSCESLSGYGPTPAAALLALAAALRERTT